MPTLTFAISDIHGEYKKLMRLMSNIRRHVANLSYGHKVEYHTKYVFMGDYVDRGPHSFLVVNYLISLPRQVSSNSTVVVLKGNHEEICYQACKGITDFYKVWINNGGEATRTSYAEWLKDYKNVVGDNVLTAMDVLVSHLDWMKALPSIHWDGSFLFVHAGIDTRIQIPNQEDGAMLYMKRAVLEQSLADYAQEIVGGYPYHVVHGHTPTKSHLPERGRYSTCIDTGAFQQPDRPLTAVMCTENDAAPVGYLTSEDVHFVRF